MWKAVISFWSFLVFLNQKVPRTRPLSLWKESHFRIQHSQHSDWKFELAARVLIVICSEAEIITWVSVKTSCEIILIRNNCRSLSKAIYIPIYEHGLVYLGKYSADSENTFSVCFASVCWKLSLELRICFILSFSGIYTSCLFSKELWLNHNIFFYTLEWAQNYDWSTGFLTKYNTW